MAGTLTLGATASNASLFSPAPAPQAYVVPPISRKRRCHGVFSLDGQLTVVYSLRRIEPGKGVQLVLGHDGPVMTPHFSPTKARMLAVALVAAADAADELRAGRG